MKAITRWGVLGLLMGGLAFAQAGPPTIAVSPTLYDFGIIAETARVETTISVRKSP